MKVSYTVKRLLEGHDYSTTQIDLPQEHRDFILQWNTSNIPEEWLYLEPDGGKGREDEPHITLLYGLTAPKPTPKLRTMFGSTSVFRIEFGKISLFEQEDHDVVKLSVQSPQLRLLHARLASACPNEDTHPDYRPHCTLAYVKKSVADNLIGKPVFAVEGAPPPFFWAKEIVFSGTDGEQEIISLQRAVEEAGPTEKIPFSGVVFSDPVSLRKWRARRVVKKLLV